MPRCCSSQRAAIDTTTSGSTVTPKLRISRTGGPCFPILHCRHTSAIVEMPFICANVLPMHFRAPWPKQRSAMGTFLKALKPPSPSSQRWGRQTSTSNPSASTSSE
eukprot:6211900-Amphidinium_carterae.1